MNKRTVMEILPQNVTEFFNEWQLRILAILSLSSQIALLFLGNRRKYKAEKWLRNILWVAYSPEDLIVAVFVGILSDCQGDGGNNPSQQLQAFWMPFLLLHLGGPDTITAYSLEDNELWTRQFFQRFLQFGWAAWKIFLTSSWEGKLLNILAVPMFIAGLTKSGEKTWFLESVSNDQLRKSAIRDRERDRDHDRDMGSTGDGGSTDDSGSIPDMDPTCKTACSGRSYPDTVLEWTRPNRPNLNIVLEWTNSPNYASFTTGGHFNGAPGCNCSCRPESEKSEEVIIHSPAPRNKTITDADLLQKADQFFPKFKRLFSGLVLDWTDLEQSKSFENVSPEEAFQVVEIELGFMYDILYSKPVAVYDGFSFLRSSIYLLQSLHSLASG